MAGFLATVIGAALMAGGSLMQWATIHDPNAANKVLDLVYKGTDVRNGKSPSGRRPCCSWGSWRCRDCDRDPHRKPSPSSWLSPR